MNDPRMPERLDNVYSAKSNEELARSYDEWARHYEEDMPPSRSGSSPKATPRRRRSTSWCAPSGAGGWIVFSVRADTYERGGSRRGSGRWRTAGSGGW